jgi:hypothetical protein
MNAIELRNEFESEMDTPVINSQGEPDIDYVRWLEEKVLSHSEALTKDRVIQILEPWLCCLCAEDRIVDGMAKEIISELSSTQESKSVDFVKIYIKSKADLPKETGVYFAHNKVQDKNITMLQRRLMNF